MEGEEGITLDQLRDVVPLREVPRPAEHCGRPMRKLQQATPAGALATVYYCERCGTQQRVAT